MGSYPARATNVKGRGEAVKSGGAVEYFPFSGTAAKWLEECGFVSVRAFGRLLKTWLRSCLYPPHDGTGSQFCPSGY